MPITTDITLSDIFDVLSEIYPYHGPKTKAYRMVEELSKSVFGAISFDSIKNKHCNAGHFGDIVFPFVQMGAISSIDIFSSVNELIIFAFYWVNRDRYKNVVDIGANIGLHTILMSRLGWHVKAYEPDPTHLKLLKQNVALNQLEFVDIVEAAVSDKSGTLDFVRVLGNTTSSHLAGSKGAPYGELEKFHVNAVDIRDIVSGIDFIKIDAEGHEKILIDSMSSLDFDHMDAMVEVGSQENANAIFDHLSAIKVNAFVQKNGWKIAKSKSDMPENYKDGSLFISKKGTMPWR